MTRRHVALLAGCLVAAGVTGVGTTGAQAEGGDGTRVPSLTVEPLTSYGVRPSPLPQPDPHRQRGGSKGLMPEIAPRGLPPVPIPEAAPTGPAPAPMPLVEPLDQRTDLLVPLGEQDPRQ